LIDVPLEKPVVWITGARGLIGTQLVEAAPAQWNIRALTFEQLDLTDFASVESEFQKRAPQFVIHCAAISKTPECQGNPAHARLVNVESTRVLAELAHDIPFFFFSTDLVFDGAKGNYVEGDATNPRSIYADTKVAAEEFVLRNPKHTVVRTSLNGGISPNRDRGFNEELRSAWVAGKTLNLFTDEYRCPIAAKVTARAVWDLVGCRARGIFHVAGSEKLSRFEIGTLLAQRHPELNPEIVPGSLKDYEGAPRSPDTSLNCTKAQRLLSFRLPKFSEWLRDNPAEDF
jgi:dTDP-4-dehydrorhamnose reductase